MIAPVVLFDVFGTLLDLDDEDTDFAVHQRFCEWLSYHGVFMRPEVSQRRFFEIIAATVARQTGEHPDCDITEVFLQLLSEAVRSRDCQPDKLVKEAAVTFRWLATRSLVEVSGMKDVLINVGTWARLGIASNTQRAYTEAELRRFDLLAPFEHIVFSSDVLARKPDPRVFDKAVDLFGTSRSRVIHVGDDLLDDIHGARRAGIRAVLLERSVAPKHPELRDLETADARVPDSHISMLPEVLRALAEDIA